VNKNSDKDLKTALPGGKSAYNLQNHP